MADAELGQEGVDRSDLNAGPAATVPQFRGIDVIAAVRREQRESRESLHDLSPSARPRETLEQLLKDEPGRDDGFTRADRTGQFADFRR